IDSGRTSAWYALARLYQPTRPLRALEIYERLIELDGDSWDLLLQSADLHSTLGRFEEAADRYRRMLALDPGNRTLQRQLAETYSRAGNFDAAIAQLESMLEIDDKDVEVLATLAEVYIERRDFRRAVPLYERILGLGHDNPEVKLRVGVAYFAQIPNDSTFIPRARNILEEVRTTAPNDWRPYFYLGAIASSEGNDSAAVGYFEWVIQLEERNFESWWFLGTHFFEKGEYDRVLEFMEKAGKVFPREARVPFLIGLTHSRAGRQEEAVAALERSFELNPNDINTIGTLALTLDGMKQYERSDSLYEHALRIDPNAHIILNNYGYSLSERGLQLERALEMAHEAVEAEPDNSAYLDTLGWVYYKLKQYHEAERYIVLSIEAGEASAVVHEHLGDVYYRLGQTDKALEYWKKALEMNGDNEELKEKIARGTL
ncbi:MAG: tetratricopeptide repeat protein, partial [Bacteroidota bacterium]